MGTGSTKVPVFSNAHPSCTVPKIVHARPAPQTVANASTLKHVLPVCMDTLSEMAHANTTQPHAPN